MERRHDRRPSNPAGEVDVNTAKSRDEGLRRLLCRRENPERFDWEDRRIAEIKMIVQRRYSGAIPQTDDADVYFRAMARTLAATYAVPVDQKSALAEWISAVAPWADAAAVADGLTIDDPHHPQPRHFRSRKLAEVLRVTYEERTTFGLTTISAFDKSPAEIEALKNERAADRKRAKRAAGGSRPRAASYSATKPWIDAGFNNRRSWELARKRARGEHRGR